MVLPAAAAKPGVHLGTKGGAFLESIRQYFKRTDKIYLLLCIFSSTMAVVALASWAAKQGNGFATDEITGAITGIGDYRRALVQAGAAVLGIVIALLLSCIDYRSLVKVWPVHVALTWGLVLPTLFIRNVAIGPLTIGFNAGDTDNYSWYKLGGFTFQPTELAKISFILTFAMHLNNVRSRINEPKELVKLLLHLAVPILIIHIQGDDGTAIIYAIIGCCMMFAAGLSWKYIIGAISAAAVAVAAAFAFFSDKIGKGYQWYRILAVIDPENSTGWAPNEATWKNIIYQQQRHRLRRHLRQRPVQRPVLQRAQCPQRLYSQLDGQCHWLCGPVHRAGGTAGTGDQDLCHRCAQRGSAGQLYLRRHRRRPDGSDRRECGHESAGAAGHRRHPALLFCGRQLGADAVYLRGACAVGLYAQHKEPVRVRLWRTGLFVHRFPPL